MDSMSSIAEHASRIEETKSRKQKTNRKTLPTANVSTASSSSSNNNNNNNNKKKNKTNDNNNNNNNDNNNGNGYDRRGNPKLPPHLQNHKRAAIERFQICGLKGCLACFGDHFTNGSLNECKYKKCYFCKIDMLNTEKGHLGAMCPKAPSTEDEFTAVVKKLQNKE